MKKLAVVFSLALALLGAPQAGAAQELRDYLGPFLDLGASVRSQVFRVHSPDGPYGEFASSRLMPTLTIGSPMLTWGTGGRYGLNLILNATAFSMDEQTPPDGDWLFGDTEDVGTSVDGYASYLVPTLNWIGENQRGGYVDQTRAGLGLGIGYLRARGDILLNRAEHGSGKTVVENPERRRIEIDDALPAFSLFMEARRGPWTLAFSIAGPVEFKSYETDYLDFALSLSYSWYRSLKVREARAATVPATPAEPAAPAAAGP
ncbi:MAG TPA: hypothetical protein VI078_02290 [bacterium]